MPYQGGKYPHMPILTILLSQRNEIIYCTTDLTPLIFPGKVHLVYKVGRKDGNCGEKNRFFFMVWSWQNDKFYSLSHIMETDFWIEIL